MAPNSLANESSPYLLQHANNPVEWYAWNDAALQKAKDENKPIFLSVGYSSCHWCHVMAHESFENEEIAEFMNEHFVNIKVDREERPDIDDIYQKVCQTVTGQGGWPLSVFLTPEQKPFYAGTYFPVLDRGRHPGFNTVIRSAAEVWEDKPKKTKDAAEMFMLKLSLDTPPQVGATLDRTILDEAMMTLFQLGDTIYGGFGSAPKFPSSANISFLFRYAKLSGISKFSDFGLKTLDKMARGGIFDQIGGGFHRYSTDSRWFVPHFEKMLYDNALIPINYAEAYQITKEPFYLDIMKKTLDFVLRDMTSAEGAFYSAYDADSQGVEGKYYVWSKKEIKEILGNDTDLFCLFYDVTDGGNWEGDNILCNNLNISSVAFKLGISEKEAKNKINESSKKLLEIRSKRVAPGLDDKILTSWNALMISAFVKGYQVTGESKYLDAAKNCIRFIQKNLLEDTALLHTFKNGTAKIDGYLDDYAYFTRSLLDIFEVHPKLEYINLAKRLGMYIIKHFWDEKSSAFFMTSDYHEQLIIRPKTIHDLSLPSSNSVACNVMYRLYHLTQEEEFLDVATANMGAHAGNAVENPFAFGYMLNTIHDYITGLTEITILNTENSEIHRSINEMFLPESIIVSISDKTSLDELSDYSFFAGKNFEDKTSVYVCKNKTCSLPLHTISEVETNL